MTLHISRNILDTLTQHANGDLPSECCGILIGRRCGEEIHVQQAMPAENIAEGDRRRSYQVDWKTLFMATRYTRQRAEEIIGFYHSHPDGPGEPSSRDVESAWINRVYVIVSMSDGRCSGVTGWRIHRNGASFVPEPIVLT